MLLRWTTLGSYRWYAPRRLALLAVAVGMGAASCSSGLGYTIAERGITNEVRYRRIAIQVPATWAVTKETALCPDYGQVGVFIEQALPASEHPSCTAVANVADAVRIGRLVGYPPTTLGVPPTINGHALTPVHLIGAVGYRDPGPLPRSFEVLGPSVNVWLFFTYSSDPTVAEGILSTVRVT